MYYLLYRTLQYNISKNITQRESISYKVFFLCDLCRDATIVEVNWPNTEYSARLSAEALNIQWLNIRSRGRLVNIAVLQVLVCIIEMHETTPWAHLFVDTPNYVTYL